MVVELSDCNIKLCHSLGCPDDCPNFRRAPGFPVFGVGQPSEEGLSKIAEKVPADGNKIIWFNMRQEPVAYVGGQPVTPRKTLNPHDNINIPGKVSDMDELEKKLITTLEERKCDAGKIDIFRDKEDADNPMDREEIKENVELEKLKSFTNILQSLSEGAMKGMEIVRVPVLEEKALPMDIFDIIVSKLVNEPPANTQCIFSSQLGQGRTTLGMTICCIIKAVQMSTKLNKMVDTGIGSKDWAEGIIKKTFMELQPSEDLKDPYLMGEFAVIKDILEKFPETKAGKVLADRMIDNCGTPPEGTGIQNLRKCIIKTKYKYDAASEDRQVVWKNMIINFIERYCYVVSFATYALEQSSLGFAKTFADWMKEKAGLTDMINAGKDKLEWSRQVDQGKVNELRTKIGTGDVKENLGDIITKLYKISHTTYSDMPRGQIKDTLMRKLTTKTLMEILPAPILEAVTAELNAKKLSADFDNVIGLVMAA